jgi:hypothetical protein
VRTSKINLEGVVRHQWNPALAASRQSFSAQSTLTHQHLMQPALQRVPLTDKGGTVPLSLAASGFSACVDQVHLILSGVRWSAL